MRVLIQRVTEAAVDVGERRVGEIGRGLLLLVGVCEGDGPEIFEQMARKIVNLRIFPDPDGDSYFHRSLLEEQGELLVVSQFTLYGDTRKGRRPSFIQAAKPPLAEELFNGFVEALRPFGLKVETGEFGGMMDVRLNNHGPTTLWLDSDEICKGK